MTKRLRRGKSRKPARRAKTSHRSAETKLAELKRRLLEINDLSAAGAVLGWDHATYMPAGGAVARARQGATLHRLAHEKAVNPALGRRLAGVVPYAASLSPRAARAGPTRG